MEAILELIHWSAQPNNKAQKQAYQRAQEMSQDPAFLINLASILNSDQSYEIQFRAAVLLKAAIRYCNQIPVEIQNMLIKVNLQVQLLRQAFIIVVPEIIVRNSIKNSQCLIEFLINMINTDPILSTDCLSKVIEDMKLNQENINFYDSSEGLQLMDNLIQQFLKLVQSNNEQVVINSLNFLNYNLFFMPPSLAQNSELYFNLLINGCNSDKQLIRMKSYQGLQALIETKRDYIFNHEQVIITCTKGMTDQDYEIKKYSELFLTDYLRIDDEADLYQAKYVRAQLQIILPQLFVNLQSEKQDQINMMAQFSSVYKGKNENEDEDEIEDTKTVTEYTLRTVSQQLLEKLIEYFENDILDIGGKLADYFIQQQDWRQMEVGVYVIGTLADVITRKNQQSVGQIMITLFNENFRNNEYLYSTILWTISQFTKWINGIGNNSGQFVVQYLQLLIKSIDNPSLIVKESACSALSTFAQEAFSLLQPYLLDLFQVYLRALDYGEAFQLYIYQSLFLIFQECEPINNQQVADLMFSSLIKRLVNLNSYNICPLYECLSAAIEKFGQCSLPYIGQIFQAAKLSIKGYLEIMKSGQIRDSFPQKEIMKRVFEISQEILHIVKNQFTQLVDQEYLSIIEIAIQDPETDVKQYAISFVGELIRECYQLIQNGNIAQILNENLYTHTVYSDPTRLYRATSNNAAWALGELALRDPQKLLPFYNDIMTKLINLINEGKLPKSISQNIGVSICRILSIEHESIFQVKQHYIQQIFKKLCLIFSQCNSQTFEPYKEESLRILNLIVQQYPNLVISDIKYYIYCMAISKQFQSVMCVFQRILQEYKQSVGDQQFNTMFSSNDLPQGFRDLLQRQYQV